MTSRAELRRTRRDLVSVLTELRARVAPSELLADVRASALRAVEDARGTATGRGLPTEAPRRRRAVAVLVGCGVVVLAVLRRLLRRD